MFDQSEVSWHLLLALNDLLSLHLSMHPQWHDTVGRLQNDSVPILYAVQIEYDKIGSQDQLQVITSVDILDQAQLLDQSV